MKNFENTTARVILKPQKERSLLQFHPWVFSGAIETVEKHPQPGDIVSVFSSRGVFLGKGFFNPHSQIRVRIFSFDETPISLDFFSQRLDQAIELRKALFDERTNAFRLVYSEADGLPGWIVDHYGESMVVQYNTLGISRLKSELQDLLIQKYHPNLIVERSDSASLKEEGGTIVKEVVYGEASTIQQVIENGITFEVDLLNGQKTGFFLDQRNNRRRIGALAADKRVLNCFSYTGGFSVYAALQGATTTSVDVSQDAQERAIENFGLNQLDARNHRFITADVGDYLRQIESDDYDLIILDPPAFIKHRRHEVQGARAYKDINRLAIQKIASPGWLLTCSCSQHMDWKLFQQVVFAASQEAQRTVKIVGKYSQPSDHPINIFHPETEYLKSFLLYIN